MKSALQNAVTKFPLDDFQNQWESVMNVLAENENISILLSREGDQVLVFYRKRYSDEVNRILAEAKREYRRRMKEGYTREQAFEEFMEAQQEISKYLRDDEIV